MVLNHHYLTSSEQKPKLLIGALISVVGKITKNNK